MSTNKGKTALLFLLAVLMLVISCSFKGLLQVDRTVQQIAQLSTKWGDVHHQGKAYKAASCCAKRRRILLVKLEVNRQELPASDLLAIQNGQTGFFLHYFLSRLQKQFSAAAISSLPPLPLFLQHRRLLI